MIVEGAFNTDLFIAFIKDLLLNMQPFPAPNSVIVMDNCSIHKAPEIRELIESRYVISFVFWHVKHWPQFSGMRLEYLPAYSPDFNPIELAFSLLKHKLRRNPPPDGSDFTTQEFLYLQTLSIGATTCRAFYHQSGYLWWVFYTSSMCSIVACIRICVQFLPNTEFPFQLSSPVFCLSDKSIK